MIIDPIANLLLDPPDGQVAHQCNEMFVAGANTKLGEVNIRGGTSPNTEDLPPPYSEIDLERGIVEGMEGAPFWARSQFLSIHESDAIAHAGMQQITEGAQIFYNLIIFIAKASLFTLGTCFESFGKIFCGIGMIMKCHRTICHPIPDN